MSQGSFRQCLEKSRGLLSHQAYGHNGKVGFRSSLEKRNGLFRKGRENWYNRVEGAMHKMMPKRLGRFMGPGIWKMADDAGNQIVYTLRYLILNITSFNLQSFNLRFDFFVYSAFNCCQIIYPYDRVFNPSHHLCHLHPREKSHIATSSMDHQRTNSAICVFDDVSTSHESLIGDEYNHGPF